MTVFTFWLVKEAKTRRRRLCQSSASRRRKEDDNKNIKVQTYTEQPLEAERVTRCLLIKHLTALQLVSVHSALPPHHFLLNSRGSLGGLVSSQY